MSIKYVKIYYGPSGFPPVHKAQKLSGLKNRLRRLGFRVDSEEIDAHEYCGLEMCGKLVFRCNIKHLQFNMNWKLDPVCQRAIDAVVEASEQLLRARTHLWACSLVEDAMFKRSEYVCLDYWVPEELPPFAPVCEDCLCRKSRFLKMGECLCDVEKCECAIEECTCDLEVCECDVKNKLGLAEDESISTGEPSLEFETEAKSEGVPFENAESIISNQVETPVLPHDGPT